MRRCIGLLVAWAMAAYGAPQQPPPITERVGVTRIVVDARVIDDAGAPVRGLLESNFFVTIGGRPARVQLAQWTGDAPAADPVAAAPPPLKIAAAESGQLGQLVVLLFQKSLHNDRAWGFVRMVEQSRDLVRALPQSNRVAILQFESSLRVYSDFTSDRDALDRILAHDLLHEPPPMSVTPGSPSLLDVLTPALLGKVSTMEGSFEMIAEALRPMPGSKAIAYVGYGMGTTPFGVRQDGGLTRARFGSLPDDLSSQAEMNNEYKKTLRSLTEARVTVFSLDITKADTHTLAGGMQAIASETGGFYAHSLDFPEKPMRFVSGALNGHYVLFVEPPVDTRDRTIVVSARADRPLSVYATSAYAAGK